jgi:hypothetical protein
MYGWLPEGARTRRVFIVLALSVCAVLLVIRFVIVPTVLGSHPPSTADVVDATLGNIIATILAATLLGVGLLWLLPTPVRPPVVESIAVHEIGSLLDSALPTTRMWWYSGSTGRYQRANTLPEMGERARREGGRREVRILILDPRDEELCHCYADYRSGLASAEGQQWTVRRVRGDLYATVLAALAYSNSFPLDVTVALKTSMSSLRYDLSESVLVVTREGRQDPALSFPSGSFHYDAYRADILLAQRQAQTVDLTLAVVPASGFDRESARAALDVLGLDTNDLKDDGLLDRALADAVSREHPYS